MAVSERTLRKWRRVALTKPSTPAGLEPLAYIYSELEIANERILILTQELLDQHLLKGRRIRNDKGGIN